MELARAGQHEAALAAFDEAVRLRPGYVDAYFTRGATLRTLGRFDEAITAFEEVARLDSPKAYPHTTRLRRRVRVLAVYPARGAERAAGDDDGVMHRNRASRRAFDRAAAITAKSTTNAAGSVRASHLLRVLLKADSISTACRHLRRPSLKLPRRSPSRRSCAVKAMSCSSRSRSCPRS